MKNYFIISFCFIVALFYSSIVLGQQFKIQVGSGISSFHNKQTFIAYAPKFSYSMGGSIESKKRFGFYGGIFMASKGAKDIKEARDIDLVYITGLLGVKYEHKNIFAVAVGGYQSSNIKKHIKSKDLIASSYTASQWRDFDFGIWSEFSKNISLNILKNKKTVLDVFVRGEYGLLKNLTNYHYILTSFDIKNRNLQVGLKIQLPYNNNKVSY